MEVVNTSRTEERTTHIPTGQPARMREEPRQVEELLDVGLAGSIATVKHQEEFQSLLRSERACAERHGHQFSVLVYESPEDRTKRESLRFTVQEASSRLRSTDVIGYLDSMTLGILLPFTSVSEAQMVAHQIRERVQLRAQPLSHRIHWQEANGNGNPRKKSAPSTAVTKQAGMHVPGITWEPRGVPILLSRELPGWKRAMDVLLAFAGLVLLSPVMFLTALVIKVTSRGPVIYKQLRTGKDFQRFRIYKFRTMRWDSDGWDQLQYLNEMSGPLFKSDHDPRVTKLGRFLRKTSLDELPQLYNVLKGDMTLVGPRALSPLPSEYEGWQLRRFDVTPGIACTWQARRRSNTNFEEWMRSDLRYVDRSSSFLADVRLLFATLLAVLRCSGSR